VIDLSTWIAFCVTEAALSLTPGPAVLFVVSAALSRGAGPGVAAALGILAANAFYFAVSATGIAAVIVASSEVFTLLKLAGAAYLVWTGVRMLRGARGAPAAASARPDVGRSFARGLVVQGANPKALIFFVALLPQFIDPGRPVAPQILVLGVSSVVIELAALVLYVFVAVRGRRIAGARLAGPLERAGGALLVAAGVRLALVRSD
jgi:homoserine/homoserine lactone efflux protein